MDNPMLARIVIRHRRAPCLTCEAPDGFPVGGEESDEETPTGQKPRAQSVRVIPNAPDLR